MSLLIRAMALINRKLIKITSLDTTSVDVDDLTPSNKRRPILAIQSLCCMNTYLLESTFKVFFAELLYGDNALSCPAAIDNCETRLAWH